MLRQLPGSRPDRSGLIAVFIELRIQRIPTVFLPYTFDWQRTFKAARPLNEKTLHNDIAGSQKAALAYFEELAEGNIFDEDFISGADRT